MHSTTIRHGQPITSEACVHGLRHTPDRDVCVCDLGDFVAVQIPGVGSSHLLHQDNGFAMVFPDISAFDGQRIYAFRAYLTNDKGERVGEKIERWEYGSVNHAKIAAVNALDDLRQGRAA